MATYKTTYKCGCSIHWDEDSKFNPVFTKVINFMECPECWKKAQGVKANSQESVEIPAAPVQTPEDAQNPAERAEVMRASYAAAESFELGGDALDNLTGQQSFLF